MTARDFWKATHDLAVDGLAKCVSDEIIAASKKGLNICYIERTLPLEMITDLCLAGFVVDQRPTRVVVSWRWSCEVRNSTRDNAK